MIPKVRSNDGLGYACLFGTEPLHAQDEGGNVQGDLGFSYLSKGAGAGQITCETTSSHRVDLQFKILGMMALAFGQMPTETKTGKVFQRQADIADDACAVKSLTRASHAARVELSPSSASSKASSSPFH